MSRSIEVDSQMLAEGMKITFFGISTVFASMGISDEAAKFLGIREAGKETSERNEFPQDDQHPAEERPVPYAAEAPDARPHMPGSKGTEAQNAGQQDVRPKDVESQDSESSQITLDEIIRVIKRKIQDDPENSDRIRSILNNKYKKEKVQELTEDGYETFLEEIMAL